MLLAPDLAVRRAATSSRSLAPPRRRSRAAARGVTLIDAMVATVILVIAALGGLSSVCASHRMNRSTEDFALATETLTRFVERLRADPDWAGLYGRLKPLSAESAGDVALARRDVDLALPTHPASSYYADFTVPTTLGTVTFLVQVPATLEAGVAALRESAAAPRYGLPFDLNGDGLVDGRPRDGDYATLPTVVRLRWSRGAQDANEIVMPTWLKGER